MYNEIHNSGTVLAFKGSKGSRKEQNSGETPISLFFWRPTTIFSWYCFTIIKLIAYFCTFKKIFVEDNLIKSEKKLQMTDIFIKDAVLSAFAMELSAVEKLLQETEQRQDVVLKLKEIDEEQLRMVVQL